MKSLPKSLFIFENVSTTLCNASKVFSTHVRQTPVREQSQVLEDPSPSLLAFRPGLGRHPSPPLCWPTQGQVFNSPPRPKILGLGSWVLGLGSWVSGLGSWVFGLGSWVLGLGPWVLGLGPWILGLGPWILGLGSWVLGLGSWVLGFGSWILGLGPWILGLGATDPSSQAILGLWGRA